ncbi:MAG: hypothetical protein PUB21_13060 [Bacteroidales bacterium]|nr:hypothetical protein [Bacteroidales bacterium]
MKRVPILVIAVLTTLISYTVSAQEDVKAGQFMIGGTGELNLEKNNYSFSINPYGEYIVADQFGLGAQLGYNVGGWGNGARNTFGVGAFAAYYLPILPNFYFKPMLEINLKFHHGTYFEIAAVPAFQYFAWEKVSFLIKAGGLSYGGWKDDYRVRLNLANSVALGMAYSF